MAKIEVPHRLFGSMRLVVASEAVNAEAILGSLWFVGDNVGLSF
jgi:hypothetical protein